MNELDYRVAIEALEKHVEQTRPIYQTAKAIDYLKKAHQKALAKQEQGDPVRVTIRDFVNAVEGKEDLVGRPIYWAQWPNEATTPQPLQKQEQGEPVAWEPIETAPKDGSMILICLPRQMNIVVRAWYNKIHNFWQTDYEGEGGITIPTYFHEGDLWHPIPPLYTTPQPAQKPLTDDELKPHIEIAMKYYGYDSTKYGLTATSGFVWLARAIEAAHGIKENT